VAIAHRIAIHLYWIDYAKNPCPVRQSGLFDGESVCDCMSHC